MALISTRSLVGQARPAAAAAHTAHPRRIARSSLRCTAVNNNNNNNKVDWDGAWKSFRKDMNSMVDTQPRPPTFTRKPPRNARDQVKRDERLLVDFWVKSSTYQVGGILFTAAFLLVVVATGPAPVDPRCTLPWC